jgi:hypothetical protein
MSLYEKLTKAPYTILKLKEEVKDDN